MDGLTLWLKILNLCKEAFSQAYYNTLLGKESVKYYDFDNNTIFVICANSFIQENMENRLKDTIYPMMKDHPDLSNITINPIMDKSEANEIIKNNITKEAPPKDNIIAKYTFDTFVTGNSNKLAYAACVSVAENPSFEEQKNGYNPLFLYGGVCLGKTHLMHAIANNIKQKNPSCKILYVSSETFTNELISAIQENKKKEFKEKYRSLDAILIDDIQFIAGKESTQEEFFHTFNDLYNANKQVIISSDRPPKELATLEDRLRSRFEMGLPIDIQAPDFETRVAILKKKCQIDGKEVSDDVLILIAKNIKSNIRELEGALNKVCAYSNLMCRDITYDLATEVLKDLFGKKNEKQVNTDYIKEVVAKEFGIKIDDFNSAKRTKRIAYPRQIAMYLCKELIDIPLMKIGEDFGGRDHTTVIHACNKITEDISTKKDNIDVIIKRLIDEIKE